ncbi:FxLYD domain-containing protein [Streptomyces sp. NPDC055749]
MSDSFPPPPQPHPQQQPPWATPPGWGGPQPPRKSSTGLIVGLSVGGAVLVLGLVGTLLYFMGNAVTNSAERRTTPSAEAMPRQEASATPTPTPTPTGTAPEEDVRITGCTVDSVIAWPHAQVAVVNGSGAAADYVVTVEFVDGDGARVAEGIVGVVGLAPGQTAKKKAQGTGEVPGDTKCRITEVYRTPAAG